MPTREFPIVNGGLSTGEATSPEQLRRIDMRCNPFSAVVQVTITGISCSFLLGCDVPRAPELPSYSKPERIVWLDQGWSREQRTWFHHASQGTSTIPIPYNWFMALERPELSIFSAGLFSSPEYLQRFGFIGSPKNAKENPDGLPVGFARSFSKNPVSEIQIDQLGLTCAACHTGQLEYHGTLILIDGAPALIDMGKFRSAIALSVGLTERLPFRFSRFADRVLGTDRTSEQEQMLRQDLAKFIERVRTLQTIELKHAGTTVEEGVGRLDALNRIGDEVFATQLHKIENAAPRTAPVAFPHIWNASWFDWVQYNGSIQQPMVRNAGEAMGVRALVSYVDGTTPRYTSTIPVDDLYKIESLLAGDPPFPNRRFTGLRAPAWPSNILPSISTKLAARGASLYRERCQGCHLPPVTSEAFWRGPDGISTPRHWEIFNDAGERLLRMPMFPVANIGTDPAQAVDMKQRTVVIPAALAIPGEIASRGDDKVYRFGPALGKMVELVVTRWYDSQVPVTPLADRDRMNGYRPAGIRDGIPGPKGQTLPAYKARPLNGIWATAPYLHNGSVPTLYDLLSPLQERPSTFYLGTRAFDADKVGYNTSKFVGGFAFDTKLRGNWNGGHLFETVSDGKNRNPGTIGRGLSPEDRRALVEYLKTL